MFPVDCTICLKCVSMFDGGTIPKNGKFDTQEAWDAAWVCYKCVAADDPGRTNGVVSFKLSADEPSLNEILRHTRDEISKSSETFSAEDFLGVEEPFTRTEEGSQERYIRRREYTPWGRHTFWWLMHNCVSHPLIGVLPFKHTFNFHDWTSRKMHGR